MEQKGLKDIEIIDKQHCPICAEKTLKVISTTKDIPYFGQVYIYSMFCNSCNFFKSEVESIEEKEAKTYELEIKTPEDLNARVVRSSEGTLKIPRMITLEPGMAAQGFVSNAEGVINRFIAAINFSVSEEEDKSKVKKAKNMVKKLKKVKMGQESIKLIVEDPKGNSAIISENVTTKPYKKKKTSKKK